MTETTTRRCRGSGVHPWRIDLDRRKAKCQICDYWFDYPPADPAPTHDIVNDGEIVTFPEEEA